MATKQNNFYLQYQLAAKAGKNADRKAFFCKAAPGALIVAGCMLAWGGVFLHTAMMRADTRDLRAWCADEQNLTPYRQSLQDQQAADAYHSLTDYANQRDQPAGKLPRPDQQRCSTASTRQVPAAASRWSSPATTPPPGCCSSTPPPIPSSTSPPTCGRCKTAASFRTWTTPATSPPTAGASPPGTR